MFREKLKQVKAFTAFKACDASASAFSYLIIITVRNLLMPPTTLSALPRIVAYLYLPADASTDSTHPRTHSLH